MSNHTPGPWVRCKEAPKIIMSGSFIDGHQGYIVGSVSGNDNSGFYAREEEAEANAILIAAAPELLKALERIAREHDCGCVPCVGSCRSKEALEITVEEIQEIARTAIAKARVKP